MYLYYTGPTQLRFWNHLTNQYSYGIGYHEFVVDVSNGTSFCTKEITDLAPHEEDKAIIEYGDWKDLSFNFNKL